MNANDTELSSQIAALRTDRERHTEAISKIDGTLSKIAAILGKLGNTNLPNDGGRQTSTQFQPAQTRLLQSDLSKNHRRKYRKLELTAAQFILQMLQTQGSSTTLEINQSWRAEGRGGVANNTLGRLLKEGLILRVELEGRRGSRYSLSPDAQSTSNRPDAPKAVTSNCGTFPSYTI